ncbi:hypothetical protein MG293_012641 [Ovis ammon polii]|uniref:Uncharacterized protein n=1 Tax=Ovis ammon polii TaxID=230172 RepID=A0AAD4Y7Y9_OVIAM|nr:hypothetical protein MG293_012641 [Ovis ammon polii]
MHPGEGPTPKARGPGQGREPVNHSILMYPKVFRVSQHSHPPLRDPSPTHVCLPLDVQDGAPSMAIPMETVMGILWREWMKWKVIHQDKETYIPRPQPPSARPKANSFLCNPSALKPRQLSTPGKMNCAESPVKGTEALSSDRAGVMASEESSGFEQKQAEERKNLVELQKAFLLQIQIMYLAFCKLLRIQRRFVPAPSCGLLVARETGRESGEFEKAKHNSYDSDFREGQVKGDKPGSAFMRYNGAICSHSKGQASTQAICVADHQDEALMLHIPVTPAENSMILLCAKLSCSLYPREFLEVPSGISGDTHTLLPDPHLSAVKQRNLRNHLINENLTQKVSCTLSLKHFPSHPQGKTVHSKAKRPLDHGRGGQKALQSCVYEPGWLCQEEAEKPEFKEMNITLGMKIEQNEDRMRWDEMGERRQKRRNKRSEKKRKEGCLQELYTVRQEAPEGSGPETLKPIDDNKLKFNAIGCLCLLMGEKKTPFNTARRPFKFMFKAYTESRLFGSEREREAENTEQHFGPQPPLRLPKHISGLCSLPSSPQYRQEVLPTVGVQSVLLADWCYLGAADIPPADARQTW